MPESLSEIKLLIFDLDGTLADTKLDIADAINRMLAKYKLHELSPDLLWSYLGDGTNFFIDKCFNYFNMKAPNDALDLFVGDYNANCLVRTKLYPQTMETLSRLGSFKKAILTNKDHKIALKICDGLQISSLFDQIAGGGIYAKKPDPEGINKIMEVLDVTSDHCAIVGDMTIDMKAGKSASVKTIAATWGVHSREILMKSKPDFMIDTLSDLIKLVEAV